MLRLKVMGTPTLERDGVPLPGRVTQRRRFALLALLAVARQRGVSRDRCMALLWPEHDAERARHSLSQLVYAIRQDLGEVLEHGYNQLRLNRGALDSDVEQFESALARGDRARAVAEYGGAFLDGFELEESESFGAWLGGERARLAAMCADALAQLIREAEATGDDVGAVALWRRRAELDPLSSRVAEGLVRALVRIGERQGAIDQARAHAQRVAALGAPPDPSVEAAALAGGEIEGNPIAQRAQPRRRRGYLVAALVLVAALAALELHGRRTTLSPPVVLVVLPGPDQELPALVARLARAALSRHAIPILPDSVVRRTLAEMRFTGSTPDDVAAVEVARRRGAGGAIVITAAGGGDDIQLLTQLFHPTSTQARTTEGIAHLRSSDLPARLKRAVRTMVTGLASAPRVRPMPPVTTRSFEALEQYAMAREALMQNDRVRAERLALAALAHDSALAMAHYMLGDLAWFADRQRDAELHMSQALAASRELPARERLAVLARFEQLVRDRPDTALRLWHRLRELHPDDPLPLEGLIWAYRALGRFRAMAAAADTALRLDPPAGWPATAYRFADLEAPADTTRLLQRIRAAGDSTGRFAEGIRVSAALRVGRVAEALRRLDSLYPPGTLGTSPPPFRTATRQALLLGLGRLAEAESELAEMLAHPVSQFPPRALVAQGRAESSRPALAAVAGARARQAVEWVRTADISPPAAARLIERAADVAARTADTRALADFRAAIHARDAGRGLRSYRIALTAIDACDAFARGDFRRAAALARQTRLETFFGRSLWTWVAMEADARRLSGDNAAADSLYRSILGGYTAGDGDEEVLVLIRREAALSVSTAASGAGPPATP